MGLDINTKTPDTHSAVVPPQEKESFDIHTEQPATSSAVALCKNW